MNGLCIQKRTRKRISREFFCLLAIVLNLMRQYFQTCLGHKEGVFPLGRGQFILGDDRPAVGAVDKDLPRAHIDHRLDGEHHAWDEQHSRALLAIMQHLGVVVELEAHTMAAGVAHHAEAVLVGVLLDGIADITDKTKGLAASIPM